MSGSSDDERSALASTSARGNTRDMARARKTIEDLDPAQDAVLVMDAPESTPESAPDDATPTELAPSDDEPSSEAEASAEIAEPLESDDPDATGQGDALTDDELLQAVTALVYASPEPITEKRIVALLEGPRLARVRGALEVMKERLAASGLPLELRAIAGGFQILTLPAMGEVVQRLFKARKAERVSAAALETLAVIAYRQPVTKAEIEAIRGVQAGPILRTLIDRGLVKVGGRADVPGHPLQYATTKEFLDRFGLATLDDLPRDSELAKD